MSLPAGAELGTTDDPKALIVGDPASLHEAADALRREASTMENVGDGLKAVRAPSWQGAASDAFWARFASEPRVWFDLQRLMTKAAGALSDQAAALKTAQAKAQDAIDKWNAGQAATKKAADAYNTEAKRRAASAPIPGLSLPMPPFHDPGDAMRDEAQHILDDARTTLDEAGMDATSLLCELGGVSWSKASGDVSGPGLDGDVEGPELTFGNDKNLYDQRAPWQKGQETGDHDSELELSLGSIAGSAYLAQAKGSVEGNYQGIDYDASGEVHVGLDAHAGASLTNHSVKAEAGASAGVSAHGEANADYGYLGVGAEGNAFAGAETQGDVEIGTEGVHAGGEAFAGAKADGELSGDVGGVGAGVTGEAWAGVGASADVDAGFHDGTFTLGGHFGVGLGIGGKVGGEIKIDPGEVLDTGKDIVDGIGGLFH